MNTAKANAEEAVDRHPARRRFFDRVWQRVMTFSGELCGTAPVQPIEIAAGSAGVVAALATLDLNQGSFAAAWWLLVLVVIRNDLADFLIPDEASGMIAVLGLAQIATLSVMAGQSAAACLTTLGAVLSGGLTAAVFLWLVGRGFRAISGREGLGFGDVKLMGASGIWLGVVQQAVALELAALAALAIVLVEARNDTRRGGVLPFGAFLAPAAWLTHMAHALSSDWLGGAS
ncbi:prepilin peptidase [Tardiphaga sp.]|uniref:prepilin peptidase n=1 Tax=Tardiphaga sp. TaxID=1926292 RepID=UPI00352BBD4B